MSAPIAGDASVTIGFAVCRNDFSSGRPRCSAISRRPLTVGLAGVTVPCDGWARSAGQRDRIRRAACCGRVPGMATISLPGQLARTRRFTLGVPEMFTVALDGTAVLFLRGRAGDDPVACLWLLDLDSGKE